MDDANLEMVAVPPEIVVGPLSDASGHRMRLDRRPAMP
jgi:hypothetical protein